LRVLFTAPHQLDGFAGQGLGNRNGLAGEVLRATAASSLRSSRIDASPP
jgi:hypothetical protein